jgi:hypothetical protein
MNNTTLRLWLLFALFALFAFTAEDCSFSSVGVVGPPSITAAKINGILNNAGSPAAGTGQSLYDLSVQYNIDAAVALAFFKHESGYGLYGMARTTRSLGNIGCEAGYACVSGFAAFRSWKQGYEAWYILISGPLYVQGGLTTVDAILHKYDPGGDNSAYVSDVVQSIQQYKS